MMLLTSFYEIKKGEYMMTIHKNDPKFKSLFMSKKPTLFVAGKCQILEGQQKHKITVFRFS